MKQRLLNLFGTKTIIFTMLLATLVASNISLKVIVYNQHQEIESLEQEIQFLQEEGLRNSLLK